MQAMSAAESLGLLAAALMLLPLAFARGEVKAGPRLLVRRTAGAARTWKV